MEELTEIILFESEKHWYLPYFFKNIVVNWTLSSLDEGSLEITVSVQARTQDFSQGGGKISREARKNFFCPPLELFCSKSQLTP